MQVDLVGRIHNISLLSQAESLTYSIRQLAAPLFEAIINSICTFKEEGITNKHVDICFERDDFQIESEVGTQDIRPIKKFRLCDITNKITEFAEDAKLITAPDNMGYFGYNESLNNIRRDHFI